MLKRCEYTLHGPIILSLSLSVSISPGRLFVTDFQLTYPGGMDELSDYSNRNYSKQFLISPPSYVQQQLHDKRAKNAYHRHAKETVPFN